MLCDIVDTSHAKLALFLYLRCLVEQDVSEHFYLLTLMGACI